MKSIFQILLLFSFMGVISCSVEPEAIDYGKDYCHSCKMNIVDKTHASQFVTKKGKQFKFDSIECLISELNTIDSKTLAFIKVANYSNPGEMTDAISATFLISTAIKSPMGMNLSAFKNPKEAEEFQQKYAGTLFNWENLNQQLASK
jgi:copper chaperone NosL